MKNETLENKVTHMVTERKKCIDEAKNGDIIFETKVNVLGRQVKVQKRKLKVVSVSEEYDMVKEIFVQGFDGPVYPGQMVVVVKRIDNVSYCEPVFVSSNRMLEKKHEICLTIYRNEENVLNDYLFQQVDEGEILEVFGPYDELVYQPLRDGKEILGVVDSYGIIPMFHLASFLASSKMNVNLHIVYFAKRVQDLCFVDRIQELCKKCKNILLDVFVAEEQEVYTTGTLSYETIRPFVFDCMSYFVCGSTHLYEKMNEILKELSVSNKFVRHGYSMNDEEIENHDEYEIRLLVKQKEYLIFGKGNESIFTAICHSDVPIDFVFLEPMCEVLEGDVYMNDENLRLADRKHHLVSCFQSYPASNLKIRF